LETQRLYALDKKYVMIKLRCPKDRLQDVAEVLRLGLRTKDGWYEPFTEESRAQFLPSGDAWIDPLTSSLFRSSDRQTVIDFITQSRFRDSGAELGQSTKLGKQIEMRVPLHMHATLESLFNCWVTYWHPVNWQGRDGQSMSVVRGRANPNDEVRQILSDSQSINLSFSNATIPTGNFDQDGGSKSSEEPPTPGMFKRYVVGAFHQPLDSIQQYYGEGVAFYFAWQQHLSYHLIFLSVCGFIVFLCQLITGNWDHPTRPYFSVVVMIWSFLVMVNWKKRQTFLAHRWGTLHYKEEEITRPQFHGDYQLCPETNEWTVQYPRWKRWLKYSISVPLVIFFTFGVLLATLMLYANRDISLNRYFTDGSEGVLSLHISVASIWQNVNVPINADQLTGDKLRDPFFWLIVLGFPSLIGLLLPLSNYIIMTFSVFLNDFENYRTQSQYQNHLIVKVFAFQFVCYFVTLYYYSFLTTTTDRSAAATENSILRVASNLLTYITVSHWWNLLLTIFFPLLYHRWRLFVHRRNLTDEVRKLDRQEADLDRGDPMQCKKMQNTRILLAQANSELWEEVMLPEYDSFHEYMYMVVQFGFVTCFSVVLPITPLICLFNHLISMRLDAYKLCRGRRRPPVVKAGGIGVWEHVLHTLTVVGVVTNCALMAFTSELFRDLEDTLGGMLALVIVCVGWEHTMLFIKYILQSASTSVPKSVADSLKRERHEKSQQRTKYVRAKKEKRSLSHSGSYDKKDGDNASVITAPAEQEPPRKPKSRTKSGEKKTNTTPRSARAHDQEKESKKPERKRTKEPQKKEATLQSVLNLSQQLHTIPSMSSHETEHSFDISLDAHDKEIQEKLTDTNLPVIAGTTPSNISSKTKAERKRSAQKSPKNKTIAPKEHNAAAATPGITPDDVEHGLGPALQKRMALDANAAAKRNSKSPRAVKVPDLTLKRVLHLQNNVTNATVGLASSSRSKQNTSVFNTLSPKARATSPRIVRTGIKGRVQPSRNRTVRTSVKLSPKAAFSSLRRRKPALVNRSTHDDSMSPLPPPLLAWPAATAKGNENSPYQLASAPSLTNIMDAVAGASADVAATLPTPCKLDLESGNGDGRAGQTYPDPPREAIKPIPGPTQRLRQKSPIPSSMKKALSPMLIATSVKEMRKLYEQRQQKNQ
jgi:ABC-type multidrug transport system fused ATPase/permease subunit